MSRQHVIIFYDPAFPMAASSERCTSGLLQVGRLSFARRLGEALRQLAMAEASSICMRRIFRKKHGPAILAYLKRGGGLISIRRRTIQASSSLDEAGGWQIEAEQTAYHRELHIHEMLPVDATFRCNASRIGRYSAAARQESLFESLQTHGIYGAACDEKQRFAASDGLCGTDETQNLSAAEGHIGKEDGKSRLLSCYGRTRRACSPAHAGCSSISR